MKMMMMTFTSEMGLVGFALWLGQVLRVLMSIILGCFDFGCQYQLRVVLSQKRLNTSENDLIQGRPVNVKHGARCTMGKVGGDKNPRGGGGILMYHYKFAVIG